MIQNHVQMGLGVIGVGGALSRNGFTVSFVQTGQLTGDRFEYLARLHRFLVGVEVGMHGAIKCGFSIAAETHSFDHVKRVSCRKSRRSAQCWEG
jgi:hypothetical protein